LRVEWPNSAADGFPVKTSLFFLLLLALLKPANAEGPAGASGRVFPVLGPWEYRWGDSPFDATGVPEWTLGGDPDRWQVIDFPSNPPGRESRTNVWYRVRLPDMAIPDMHLFIYSVDLIVQIYLEGRLIYAFGTFDAQGRGQFAGWPWHLVELPQNAAGKMLYFRVFSDYKDIGLWGEVLLGRGRDHMVRMLRRDGVRLAVALISLTIGVIFLAVFILRRADRASLFLSLVCLALVVRVLSQTQVHRLAIDAPLIMEHVKAGSYFVIPAFVALFLEQILGRAYRRITRIIWITTLVLTAIVLFVSLTGLASLIDFFLLSDSILIVVMAVLAFLSIRAAAQGNTEARLVATNFVLMALLGFYSILVSNGLLPWSDDVDYLLLFQFALGLAFVLVRRYVGFRRRMEDVIARSEQQAEQLRSLRSDLDSKVAERTRHLEKANQRLLEEKITLQITSITDGLTGLYNRNYTLGRLESEVSEARRYRKHLSVIMFDLDHFKRINDSHGHQVGDMAMKKVAAILRGNLRDSDLAGRYGGEEFLVVLPETESEEARSVAERIRGQVEGLAWVEPSLRVTLSGGVAQYHNESAEQLIRRADFQLYGAKEAGRNRVFTAGRPERQTEADVGQ
jgi:diguanylate cyclase (GGDEF)-like protein